MPPFQPASAAKARICPQANARAWLAPPLQPLRRVSTQQARALAVRKAQFNAYAEPYQDVAAATVRGDALRSHVGIWPAHALLNHSCSPNACTLVLGGYTFWVGAWPCGCSDLWDLVSDDCLSKGSDAECGVVPWAALPRCSCNAQYRLSSQMIAC